MGIIMKRTKSYIYIVLASIAVFMLSCSKAREQRAAAAHVSAAFELIEAHRYEAALHQLDSVHTLYPKQVEQRKQAKALKDKIVYLQSLQTKLYADSILQPLLSQADNLLKEFRYEKQEGYEDHGHYVYRNLQTGWNTNRCFLQAYVSDDRKALVKSYYYGAKQLNQQAVNMQAAGEEIEIRGKNHAFEVDGWHEILTLEGEQALEVLNFVSAHLTDRIRVTVVGSSGKAGTVVYYLSDSEKQALDKTYQLGILMRDIDELERQIQLALRRIEHFENRNNQ